MSCFQQLASSSVAIKALMYRYRKNEEHNSLPWNFEQKAEEVRQIGIAIGKIRPAGRFRAVSRDA